MFLSPKVCYLGHIVSEEGVWPDPQKISAVQKCPTPRNEKNIREFLGILGYYRNCIPNFADRARPLTNLLKKNAPFLWPELQECSFRDLKDTLCHEPILQHPDLEKPFILTTEASDFAMGAVPSQGKLGEDLPFAYASRTMIRVEINYTTTEKEYLAVVTFVKHFRLFLYGRKFTVVIDHQALVWLHSVKDPSSRLMRSKNKVADARGKPLRSSLHRRILRPCKEVPAIPHAFENDLEHRGR